MPDNRQDRQRCYTVSTLRPEAVVFHSSVSRLQSDVLLKTAINSVCSGFMQTDACTLFDEGAHKSLITEKLACDSGVATISPCRPSLQVGQEDDIFKSSKNAIKTEGGSSRLIESSVSLALICLLGK